VTQKIRKSFASVTFKTASLYKILIFSILRSAQYTEVVLWAIFNNRRCFIVKLHFMTYPQNLGLSMNKAIED